MRNKWPFKQPMEAICRPGKTHKSPVEDCTCGIYGTIDFFEAADWLDWNKRNTHLELQTVIGLVKFWGNVIEYDSGFKAQYAYPSEIWIPPNSWYKAGTMKSTERMAREIQMAYGIPAQAIDDITEVTDYDRNLAGQHEVVNSEWLLGREC
ncbi:hypothetical protein KGP36_06405 [Patescibacteria group bacterium]|nr:hypothetical protein [Patescibacteria group bacterium]